MEQSHQLQQNSEIREEQSWGSLLPVAGPHEAHGRGEIIASSEALGEYVDRVSQLAPTMWNLVLPSAGSSKVECESKNGSHQCLHPQIKPQMTPKIS